MSLEYIFHLTPNLVLANNNKSCTSIKLTKAVPPKFIHQYHEKPEREAGIRRTISNIRTARKIKPQIHEIKALRDNIPNKPLQLGAGHLVGNILYIYPSRISLQPISRSQEGGITLSMTVVRVSSPASIFAMSTAFFSGLVTGFGFGGVLIVLPIGPGPTRPAECRAVRTISSKSAFPLPFMGT